MSVATLTEVEERHSREAIEASAKELADATKRRIIPIVADTTSSESVRRLVDTTRAQLGRAHRCCRNVDGTQPSAQRGQATGAVSVGPSHHRLRQPCPRSQISRTPAPSDCGAPDRPGSQRKTGSIAT